MSKDNLESYASGAPRLRAIGFNEHLEFFDKNNDQKISIRESQKGLERLGFGHLLTIPAAFAINFGVSGLGLLQGRLVNPVNLALPRTGFVRHTDTDLVDDNGEFNDARLDAVLATYGKEFAGEALTLAELSAMLAARIVKDATTGANTKELLLLPVGVTAVAVEWGALFWVAGTTRDGKPVLEKDTVRRFYTDSQFFHDVAQRLADKRAARSQTPLGVARNILQDWLL